MHSLVSFFTRCVSIRSRSMSPLRVAIVLYPTATVQVRRTNLSPRPVTLGSILWCQGVYNNLNGFAPINVLACSRDSRAGRHSRTLSSIDYGKDTQKKSSHRGNSTSEKSTRRNASTIREKEKQKKMLEEKARHLYNRLVSWGKCAFVNVVVSPYLAKENLKSQKKKKRTWKEVSEAKFG